MFFTEDNDDEKEDYFFPSSLLQIRLKEANAKGSDALAVAPLGLRLREADLARPVVRRERPSRSRSMLSLRPHTLQPSSR